MRIRPRLWRRSVPVGLAAAALALTGVALGAGSPAAHAATCGGYVGITFDDGPSNDHTPALLNALKANGMRATLFNEGQYAAAYPAQVQAEVNAGMWVGNHSYTHPHLIQESQAQIDSEVSRTQQAISSAGGGTPQLFRPPYGETNATLQAVEAKYGLTQVIWDVDSQDWNGASVDAIVAANGRLANGQVILMHEWPANTLTAIPRIAQTLASHNLCAGMISPQTGRAVAPTGGGGTDRRDHDWRNDRRHHGRRGRQLHRDPLGGHVVERPLQPQRRRGRLQHLDGHDERPGAGEGHRDLEHQRGLSQCPGAEGDTQRQRQQLGRDDPDERHVDLADGELQYHLIRSGPRPVGFRDGATRRGGSIPSRRSTRPWATACAKPCGPRAEDPCATRMRPVRDP